MLVPLTQTILIGEFSWKTIHRNENTYTFTKGYIELQYQLLGGLYFLRNATRLQKALPGDSAGCA